MKWIFISITKQFGQPGLYGYSRTQLIAKFTYNKIISSNIVERDISEKFLCITVYSNIGSKVHF